MSLVPFEDPSEYEDAIPAAPQPVSDPAPSPTPSVSTGLGNAEVRLLADFEAHYQAMPYHGGIKEVLFHDWLYAKLKEFYARTSGDGRQPAEGSAAPSAAGTQEPPKVEELEEAIVSATEEIWDLMSGPDKYDRWTIAAIIRKRLRPHFPPASQTPDVESVAKHMWETYYKPLGVYDSWEQVGKADKDIHLLTVERVLNSLATPASTAPGSAPAKHRAL